MAKKTAKKQSVNETGKSLKPIFKDAVKSKKTLPKLKLRYETWPFFEWIDEFDDASSKSEPVSTDGTFDGNWKRLIDATKSDFSI